MYKNISYQQLKFHLLLLVLISITVSFCSSAFSQNPNPSEIISAGEHPRLKLAETTHDFGDVWQGDEVNCVFELFNEGEGNFTIIKQKTTCGCTVAKPINGSISPGSKKNLEVSFAVGNKIGHTAKRILLYTNDPKQPEVMLTVTANVKQSVEIVPSQLDFEDIAIGTVIEKKIELKRKNGTGPIKIKKFLFPSNDISAKLVEETENGCKFLVTFTPSLATEMSENLGIIVQDKGLPFIKLPIKAKVHNIFFVSPDRIYMGVVKAGEKVSRTITIGAPASDKLEKLSFPSGDDNENIEIVSQPDNGNQYKVQITWSPKKDSKNLLYHLSITAISCKGAVETIDVPCYGLIAD
ncbi:MAG: DUF1573 domain-containing protein [Planctomycetota bacterium]|nr:DUF1573 domain-containing protein [Planctomycetota bacterium]